MGQDEPIALNGFLLFSLGFLSIRRRGGGSSSKQLVSKQG